MLKGSIQNESSLPAVLVRKPLEFETYKYHDLLYPGTLAS